MLWLLLRPCPAFLRYWPLFRNLSQARGITLGDTPKLLATRRMDEPSWSNWAAWASSQGCSNLMMFTMEVIRPNAKEKRRISTVYCHKWKTGSVSPYKTPVLGVVWHFTLLSTRCQLHLGQWQWNRFTNGQASQLVRLEPSTRPYNGVIPYKRSVP